jgi:hypothetical protein
MGRACGTYEGEECIEFSWGNLRERNNSKHLEVDGNIILKRVLQGIKWRHVKCLFSAPDRNKWWAVVITVMNPLVL